MNNKAKERFLETLRDFCRAEGFAIVPTYQNMTSFHDRMEIIKWDEDTDKFYERTKIDGDEIERRK
jgi:hypothetical protein